MAREFDRVNEINTDKQEIIDIDSFFREMDLTKEQIDERISFAKESRDFFLFILAYLAVQYEKSAIDYVATNNQFLNGYRNIIDGYVDRDDNINRYTERYVDDTLDTTQKRLAMELADSNVNVEQVLDNSYYLSEARAVEMAVNAALDVVNYKDFVTAIKRGFKHKKWISMADRKVRKTHRIADGQVVPIGEYFHVGNALLAFPHDTITDGSTGDMFLEEIINCRCSFRYIQ